MVRVLEGAAYVCPEGTEGTRKGVQREAYVCFGGSEMKHSFTVAPKARKVHFMMIITFCLGCALSLNLQSTDCAPLRSLMQFFRKFS